MFNFLTFFLILSMASRRYASFQVDSYFACQSFSLSPLSLSPQTATVAQVLRILNILVFMI